MKNNFQFLLVACLTLVGTASSIQAEAAKPIRALMVCGGCCHDYENQKRILSEGISKRANVVWTIVHDVDTTREHQIGIYTNADWAKGYDVVVHNECYGYVTNNAFVEGIAKPHFEGLPAVVLHCSTHSYRMAKTDEWRQLIGQSSFSHETRRDLDVKLINGEHPVMKGFPKEWHDPQDELYKNEKLWPNFIPLAKAYGVDTKKEHVCVWLNTYGKARVFGTTLGHTDDTMSSDVYLNLVARGLLWACDKLDDQGNPKPGYGPVTK
jgi:type 1 glutamine amidotransferase